MRRFLLVSPLVVAIAVCLIVPVIESARLSLYTWTEDGFSGPMSMRAYGHLFVNYRAGQILRCLGIALGAGLLTAATWIPVSTVLAACGGTRVLVALEGLLVLPFLMSYPVRVFSERALVAPGGWLNALAGRMQLVEPLRGVLYSDEGTLLSLSWGLSALLVIPFLRSVSNIHGSVFASMMDVGMPLWRRSLTIFRLSKNGLMTGASLFLVVAWFAPLEYRFLGTNRSALVAIEGLIGVRRYPEAFALGTIVSTTTLAILWLVLSSGRSAWLLPSKKSDV